MAQSKTGEKVNPINVLQQVSQETSGAALTLSPKEEGRWSGYLLQQKKSFEEESIDKLCEVMVNHIVDNRIANDKQAPKKEGKRKVKPFKYNK